MSFASHCISRSMNSQWVIGCAGSSAGRLQAQHSKQAASRGISAECRQAREEADSPATAMQSSRNRAAKQNAPT